jgi:ribosomal protein S18 acetylase RimI-like enzyme
MINVRPSSESDQGAVRDIILPVIQAGETYALPEDWTKAQAVAYWYAPPHRVFVAEESGRILGTYFLQPNQRGPGDHIANCGYITSSDAIGRGVASAMCAHSLAEAAASGFRAMQFNFVVSTNRRAIALWQKFGFEIVGTLPGAFRHPKLGYVDAYVMFRMLDANAASAEAGHQH